MASGNKAPGMLMRNAGIFNPVLVQAVGLCPVVAMATSVKSALLLAAVSAFIITTSEFVASLFLKAVPRWIRIGIYIILGGAIVVPFMILIERVNAPLFGSFGIYLPIMAVNSLNVLRCERFAVKISPFSAILDGITASVGYAAVLIVVGFIRELLGEGSILDFRIFERFAMPGLLLPFGGFIVLGFAGAVLRTLISKFWPKYLDKKQPKPVVKTKKAKASSKKNIQAVIEVPEFAADESPFNLEDISQYDDSDIQYYDGNLPTEDAEAPVEEYVEAPVEEYVEAPVEEYVEAPAEEHVEAPAEEHVEAPAEEYVEAPAEEHVEAPAEEHVEAPAEEYVEAPAEEHVEAPAEAAPVFKELSLDDIDYDVTTPSGETYSEADDELEQLMSRSIGDVLSKQKKEDEEK